LQFKCIRNIFEKGGKFRNSNLTDKIVWWVVVDHQLLLIDPEENFSVFRLLKEVQKPLEVLIVPHFRFDKLFQVLLDLVDHPYES